MEFKSYFYLGTSSNSDHLKVVSLGRKLGITECNTLVGDKIAELASKGNLKAQIICEENSEFFNICNNIVEKSVCDNISFVMYNSILNFLNNGKLLKFRLRIYSDENVCEFKYNLSSKILSKLYGHEFVTISDFKLYFNRVVNDKLKSFIFSQDNPNMFLFEFYGNRHIVDGHYILFSTKINSIQIM